MLSNHLISNNTDTFESIFTLKDLYSCPIEIIIGLTDKGQFQYLIGLKGPKRGLTCI